MCCRPTASTPAGTSGPTASRTRARSTSGGGRRSTSTPTTRCSRPTCSTSTATSTASAAEVRFVHFLRSERKFDGIDALVAQLKHDVEHARRAARVPSTTFDRRVGQCGTDRSARRPDRPCRRLVVDALDQVGVVAAVDRSAPGRRTAPPRRRRRPRLEQRRVEQPEGSPCGVVVDDQLRLGRPAERLALGERWFGLPCALMSSTADCRRGRRIGDGVGQALHRRPHEVLHRRRVLGRGSSAFV